MTDRRQVVTRVPNLTSLQVCCVLNTEALNVRHSYQDTVPVFDVEILKQAVASLEAGVIWAGRSGKPQL